MHTTRQRRMLTYLWADTWWSRGGALPDPGAALGAAIAWGRPRAPTTAAAHPPETPQRVRHPPPWCLHHRWSQHCGARGQCGAPRLGPQAPQPTRRPPLPAVSTMHPAFPEVRRLSRSMAQQMLSPPGQWLGSDGWPVTQGQRITWRAGVKSGVRSSCLRVMFSWGFQTPILPSRSAAAPLPGTRPAACNRHQTALSAADAAAAVAFGKSS
jgi:hypothetical protein